MTQARNRTRIVTPALLVLAFAAPADAARAALPQGLFAERLAGGLQDPTDLAAAGDGAVLVTEKAGAVRLVRDGALLPDPVARVEPRTGGDAGLLGIATAPDFATSGLFVVAYTPRSDPSTIRVTRLRLSGTTAEIVEDPWIVVLSHPGAERHLGGTLGFDRDGRVYVSLGDLDDPEGAGLFLSLPGSILRYDPDGRGAQANPVPHHPVFAFGLRDPRPFDFAADGSLWVADPGPLLHDEIDLVVRGGNYGWPAAQGRCDHYPLLEACLEGVDRDPSYEFEDPTGPAGLAFYAAGPMPALLGDLLVTGRVTGEIHRFHVEDDTSLTPLDPLFVMPGEAPRLGTIHVGDDGSLLFLADDAVLRIAPEDDLFDASQIVEEGAPRPPLLVEPAQACAQAGGPAGALALVLAALLALHRRRRRAPALAVLLVALALPAPARAVKVSTAPRSFGFEVGLTLARLVGDGTEFATIRPGAILGFAGRLPIVDVLGLAPEVAVASMGTNLSFTTQRLDLLWLFVAAPLDSGISLPPWRFSVFAGPAFGFLLTSRLQDVSLDVLRNWELALQGGLGVELATSAGTITLQARYQQGLTNLLDPRMRPPDQRPEATYERAWLLVLGALF